MLAVVSIYDRRPTRMFRNFRLSAFLLCLLATTVGLGRDARFTEQDLHVSEQFISRMLVATSWAQFRCLILASQSSLQQANARSEANTRRLSLQEHHVRTMVAGT